MNTFDYILIDTLIFGTVGILLVEAGKRMVKDFLAQITGRKQNGKFASRNR